MNGETNIQNTILLATGERSDTFAWRNQTGVFRAMDGDRVVKVGIVGAPDILSVVAVTITPEMVGKTIGVAVGIEVKTAKGKQADDQKKWQRAFEKKGGVYLLARSKQEANEKLDTLSAVICNR